MANQISFSKRMAMAQEIVNKLNQKEEAENVKNGEVLHGHAEHEGMLPIGAYQQQGRRRGDPRSVQRTDGSGQGDPDEAAV